MSKNFLSLTILFILYLGLPNGEVNASTLDSLRSEIIDGQVYVIHQVDKGETLYAISRRYGASMDDIA